MEDIREQCMMISNTTAQYPTAATTLLCAMTDAVVSEGANEENGDNLLTKVGPAAGVSSRG